MKIIPTLSFPTNYKCSFLCNFFVFPSFLSTSFLFPFLFFSSFPSLLFSPSFLLHVFWELGRGSSNSSTASELDDEPPCLEEIEHVPTAARDSGKELLRAGPADPRVRFPQGWGEEEEEDRAGQCHPLTLRLIASSQLSGYWISCHAAALPSDTRNFSTESPEGGHHPYIQISFPSFTIRWGWLLNHSILRIGLGQNIHSDVMEKPKQMFWPTQ